eukprot:3330841-Rhodomonas_salina.3
MFRMWPCAFWHCSSDCVLSYRSRDLCYQDSGIRDDPRPPAPDRVRPGQIRCEIQHKTAQSQYKLCQECVFLSLISGCGSRCAAVLLPCDVMWGSHGSDARRARAWSMVLRDVRCAVF